MVSSAAVNSLITKEDSVPRADGKGDEATSVVSATESDSGEVTSLSSTFVVLSSCCKVPFLLSNDRSTKLLTSLVAISFFCPCGMGQFCYPKAEKAGSKDAFEKADFRYQLPDEFSDSQRKELQTSDLRLYPMKRKA